MLDRLVAGVRAGQSLAMVLCGEPGVGKTALLEHVVEQVTGFRVARAAGVQPETDLTFAGLHRLCAPMLRWAEVLPVHQRDALQAALGMRGEPGPNRFLVGLAVEGLLTEVARERPLLLVVDDAQWLDRASLQALTFAARRLESQPVALILATREPACTPELTGLRKLVVAGLPDAEARALVRSFHRGPSDDQVLDRLVAETRGNPAALLGLTPAELAGGSGSPGAQALPRWVEKEYLQSLPASLPAATRRLVLIAAAEPLGDPVLLWRAGARLEIGVEAVEPAAAAGLLEVGAHVRFQHPLHRSVVYQAASVLERRIAHRALAEVTDPVADPDRRAWHRAQAAAQPDEEVVGDLQRTAALARARGGPAAAAAFLQRAAELTPPERARRAERALVAAQAAHRAGKPDAALRMLSLAEVDPLDEPQRARLELLRAQITFAVNPGSEAPPLLLRAARQLEPLDVQLARETYLDALSAAMIASPLAGVREVAEAARSAPPSALPSRATDLLLDGLATRYTDGYTAGLPTLKRALDAVLSHDISRRDGLRLPWPAHITAVNLWDDEALEMVATRCLQVARDAGASTTLPLVLNSRIATHVLVGELAAAAPLLDELDAVTEATGSPLTPYGAVLLAAWHGRESEACELIGSTVTDALRRGEGFGLIVSYRAKALLCNSLGRYEDALAAAEHAENVCPQASGMPTWGTLIELIEAAGRSAMPEHASAAYQRLAEATDASGTEWALGIQARSRALLSNGKAAEEAYRESIARLGRTRIRGELARAHLLYGEWLRRANSRLRAREQLRIAFRMFTAMDMEAFARRATRELQAAGQRSRRRTVEKDGELTSQEMQIVGLVREGLSNPEIAARLFLSPRTVEWHLHKIFGKLHITSRVQLYR
ncbi:LuxR family transcriptional regulator [Pseudonocardia yunnanensis]